MHGIGFFLHPHDLVDLVRVLAIRAADGAKAIFPAGSAADCECVGGEICCGWRSRFRFVPPTGVIEPWEAFGFLEELFCLLLFFSIVDPDVVVSSEEGVVSREDRLAVVLQERMSGR